MFKVTYKRQKKNKYGAKKVTVDGITFDSVKESRRYKVLKQMQENGEIAGLELQRRWVLQDGFRDKDGKWVRPITYLSDFNYTENGVKIVEDVKSPVTAKDSVFLLKMKMFLKKYGDEYNFRVVI